MRPSKLSLEYYQISNMFLCKNQVYSAVHVSSPFTCDRSYIDELPASIVECRNLHRLAAHTMLLGKLPEGFGRLPHLVELNLSHNPLQSLPRGFGGLPSLKVLKLSGGFFHTSSGNLSVTV